MTDAPNKIKKGLGRHIPVNRRSLSAIYISKAESSAHDEHLEGAGKEGGERELLDRSPAVFCWKPTSSNSGCTTSFRYCLQKIPQLWGSGLDWTGFHLMRNRLLFNMKLGHSWVFHVHPDWFEMSLSLLALDGMDQRQVRETQFSPCHEMWAICRTRVWISCRHNGQVSSCKAHSMHRSLKRMNGGYLGVFCWVTECTFMNYKLFKDYPLFLYSTRRGPSGHFLQLF